MWKRTYMSSVRQFFVNLTTFNNSNNISDYYTEKSDLLSFAANDNSLIDNLIKQFWRISVSNTTNAVDIKNSRQMPSTSSSSLSSSSSSSSPSSGFYLNDLEFDYSFSSSSIYKYFTSSYALIYFISIFIIRRFIIITSLRSTAHNVRLPISSKILLHGIFAIIPLSLGILQLLIQIGFIKSVDTFSFIPLNKSTDLNYMFNNLLIILSLSNTIETFYCSTTNITPLIDSNHSLFDTSLLSFISTITYYSSPSVSTSSSETNFRHTPLNKEQYIQFLFIFVDRLSIHLLELFNKRNFRLVQDTILSLLFIAYYSMKQIMGEFDSIGIITKLILFPYLVSLFVIVSYCIIHDLTVLIKFIKNKNSNNEYSFHVLRYYLYSKLNFDGTSNLFPIIANLSLLVCGGVQDIDTEMIISPLTSKNDNNGSHIKYPSYFISGYLNKLENVPEQSLLQEDNANNTNIRKSSSSKYSMFESPRIMKRFIMTSKIVKWAIYNIVETTKTLLFGEKIIDNLHNSSIHKVKDFNILVTPKNYTKFLTRVDMQNNDEMISIDDSINKYLLPTFDTSKDYVFHEEIEDQDDSIGGTDDDEMVVKTELKDLLTVAEDGIENANNLKWMVSVWSMLKFQLKGKNDVNKRLTRSQYGKMNGDNILSEIILENEMDNELIQHNNNVLIREQNDDKQQDSAENRDMFPDIKLDDYAEEDCMNEEETVLPCAICNEHSRNIILWPCRCLAVCNSCRDTLGRRGFQQCVCCRCTVQGYTRVNIV